MERYQLEFINIVVAITCGDCSACRRLEDEVSTLDVFDNAACMMQHDHCALDCVILCTVICTT